MSQVPFNTGFLLMLAMLLAGCGKEGCTDEAAVNYNITADRDDGSCVYCTDSNVASGPILDNFIEDDRFSSPFQNQTVLDITVQTRFVNFPLGNCGESGCSIVVTASNITDAAISNLEFVVSINFNDFSSQTFFSGPMPDLGIGESHTFSPRPIGFSTTECPELNSVQFPGEILSAQYN